MIWTSNFSRSSKEPGAISIARSSPDWSSGSREFRGLAPPPSLLFTYKAGLKVLRGDVEGQAKLWERYKVQYAKVLALLDPERVLASLKRLVEPYEPVLLCWCAKGKPCHRQLVAEWLPTEVREL